MTPDWTFRTKRFRAIYWTICDGTLGVGEIFRVGEEWPIGVSIGRPDRHRRICEAVDKATTRIIYDGLPKLIS